MQIRLTLITALLGMGSLMLLPAETFAQGVSGVLLPRQVEPSPLTPTPAPAYPELFPAESAAPFSATPVQLAPVPPEKIDPTLGDLVSAINAPDAAFGQLAALEDISNGVLRLEKIKFVDAVSLVPNPDVPAYRNARAANQGRLQQLFVERGRSTNPIKVTKTGSNQLLTLDQALSQINTDNLSINNVVALKVYGNDQVIIFFDKTPL
jgi:hypothetical protein